jgi:ribulose-5-phosphate 4-epimerase/fuculose-1-phosphate aldolase
VIHTHSTHLVGCSLQADTAAHGELAADAQLLPPITPYFVMKVGRVPHIPYHRPGDAAAATLVAQTITRHAAQGSPVRAVMLARLGPNVWHDTPAAAMAVLEELEETARLWMLCQPRPTPLNEPQIEELRQAFGAQW